MQPRLTILLLCWNHERYLEQCIGALAAQTSRDFDVVFLDNVSTDNSAALAARLLAESGIAHRILTNDRPQAIAANLNHMLAESTGSLIAFLSTDDWFAPQYVETMIDASIEQPDAGWFSCAGWLYYECEQRSVAVEASQFATDQDVTKVILEGGDPHFFIGCAYRRSALDAVGGWDEQLLIEDRDLFLRLSFQFRHHAITARLVHYRRSSMAASSNAKFMIEGWERFYAKHAAAFGPGLTTQRARTYQQYAATAVDSGNVRHAAALLAKALVLRPLALQSYRTAAYLLRRIVKKVGKT